jgi:hypothetical protein
LLMVRFIAISGTSDFVTWIDVTAHAEMVQQRQQQTFLGKYSKDQYHRLCNAESLSDVRWAILSRILKLYKGKEGYKRGFRLRNALHPHQRYGLLMTAVFNLIVVFDLKFGTKRSLFFCLLQLIFRWLRRAALQVSLIPYPSSLINDSGVASGCEFFAAWLTQSDRIAFTFKSVSICG